MSGHVTILTSSQVACVVDAGCESAQSVAWFHKLAEWFLQWKDQSRSSFMDTDNAAKLGPQWKSLMDSCSQATGSDSCANVARTLQNSPLFQATGEIFSRLVACGHHVSVISRYRRQILPASELGQQCQWFRSQTSKKQLSLDSRWHLHTDHGCQ